MKSQQLARDIKTGRDKEQFRAEGGKSAMDEFNRRVAERIRKAKERNAKQRGFVYHPRCAGPCWP